MGMKERIGDMMFTASVFVKRALVGNQWAVFERIGDMMFPASVFVLGVRLGRLSLSWVSGLGVKLGCVGLKCLKTLTYSCAFFSLFNINSNF